MAKKRTTIAFYGKIEQARESLAALYTRLGRHDDATALRNENSAVMKMKRETPYSRLAPWIGRAILPDGTNGRWEKGRAVPRLAGAEA